MISLNKFSFGPPENFVNAYISADFQKVIVLTKSTALSYPVVLDHGQLDDHDKEKFIFYLPDEYKEDIEKIMKGQYSRISDRAKDKLRAHSGLNYKRYKKKEDGSEVYITDARLRALDRDEELRLLMEDWLGIDLSQEDELISPPDLSTEIWVDVKGLVGA